MTDQFDQAAELEQWQREIAIKKHRTLPNQQSAKYCTDCGDEIPELRRHSVPGVCRCVACQTIIERKQREFKR